MIGYKGTTDFSKKTTIQFHFVFYDVLERWNKYSYFISWDYLKTNLLPTLVLMGSKV